MKEKDNKTKNFQWRKIFRKKWFFPAIYLIVATTLLTVVVWYQSLDNHIPDQAEEQEVGNNYVIEPDNDQEDSVPVLDQQEVVKMPVSDQQQTNIVTKFYEYDADDEDQQNALIYHNDNYYQSTGIDIAAEDGETFDVLAALSGTVTNVKEDPLLGKVVVLSHDDNVDTYYSSLAEMNVKAGEKISQGDLIGTAGKSIFGKNHGVHVHFEIRKDDQTMNPEIFFNQPLSKLGADDGNDTEDNTNEVEDDVNEAENDPDEVEDNSGELENDDEENNEE